MLQLHWWHRMFCGSRFSRVMFITIAMEGQKLPFILHVLPKFILNQLCHPSVHSHTVWHPVSSNHLYLILKWKMFTLCTWMMRKKCDHYLWSQRTRLLQKKVELGLRWTHSFRRATYSMNNFGTKNPWTKMTIGEVTLLKRIKPGSSILRVPMM